MIHKSFLTILSAIAIFSAGIAPNSFAQVGGGLIAPLDAMDTLNAPTAAGGAPQAGEAAAVGQPNQPQSPPPAAPASAGSNGSAAGATASTQDEETVEVLTGARIFCAIFKDKLLDDAKIKAVPKSELKNYFDNGTNGDQIAGDKLYSKVDVIRGQYLSAEANTIRRKSLASLIHTATVNPESFFLMPVVAGGDSDALVNEMDLERSRDMKLLEWAKNWLDPYRMEPGNMKSEFLPVYIPEPPQIPEGNPPATFDPSVPPGRSPEPVAAPGGAGGLGGLGGDPYGGLGGGGGGGLEYQ